MRAPAAMTAMIVLACAAAAVRADGPRATPIGFDHGVHDRDVVVSGADAVPCTRCHVDRGGKLAGKPDHTTCFGTCHGAKPTAPARGTRLVIADDRVKLCTACHAEAVLVAPFTGKLPVAYPPYKLDPDHSLVLGHAQHARLDCAQCHDLAAKVKPAAHTRCLGCHDGSGAVGRGPAMTKCDSCHPAAIGTPQPPQLAALIDTVGSAFSHTKHAVRGPAGKECTTCHAAVAKTDDWQLPRPKVEQCATCHDGKAAFATTVACTRCHDRGPGPGETFKVFRPPWRFVHTGSHTEAVSSKPCLACHPLDPKGNVLVAGHEACTSCHLASFGARKPKICGACHNATEPWRHLIADRAPPERTEFGASLDHGKHPGECQSCHLLRTVSDQLRTPRGHRSCLGSGCHEVGTGPIPQMTSCSGCHLLGRAAAREAKRGDAAWSVRFGFDHRTHATAPDRTPLACTTCHGDLKAASVVELPTPKKLACQTCHDSGKAAFKLTGTTCARCHAPRPPPPPPPAIDDEIKIEDAT